MNLLIEAYLDLFAMALANGMSLTPELKTAINSIEQHFTNHGWKLEISGSEDTFYYFHFVKDETGINQQFIVQMEYGNPVIVDLGKENND